jgi:hypothetical protein
MKKILCVGDGFGKGHIWPMWPQLLEKILDNVQITNFSSVGAGNEFICNSVLSACKKNKFDMVLVQWAISKRLDIINNKENNISSIILYDKIYNKKYSNIKIDDRSWWLSSDSQLEYVKKYHQNYISIEQHKLRSINYIKLTELYLKQIQMKNFLFFSSNKLDFLNLPESECLDWTVWNEHLGKNSMAEYAEKHCSQYQTQEVQPHPMVHLKYLKEILLPKLHMKVKNKKIEDITKQIEVNYKSVIKNV